MTIALAEIDFAESLIQISPTIARVDNFDDSNLYNNISNNSPIYHALAIKHNHYSKWITRTHHMINYEHNCHSRITIL